MQDRIIKFLVSGPFAVTFISMAVYAVQTCIGNIQFMICKSLEMAGEELPQERWREVWYAVCAGLLVLVFPFARYLNFQNMQRLPLVIVSALVVAFSCLAI